ncbi:MAG TPA: hypothetical protein VNJ54_08345 [Plantibacter sp.]|uniref:hypothetical protein n=1 Tax=Plantibacter sp. TaxID=1871045 RepID=UPI002BD62718|nr:hypothetical protein [Plantibacter sp.]
MTTAPSQPIDGFPLIGRHPVLANAPLIAVLSGIAAAMFGTLTGALLGGILDIDFGPAITIPIWFLAIAGACLIYLGVAYRRIGVDTTRGTARIDGEIVPLRAIAGGVLLTHTPAATVPTLSLRLTTDTGTNVRIIVNGGWLRPMRPHDFIPLAALIAGSSIPDETGDDPITVGRERISRALAGKSTDREITRRAFLIDCIAATEQSGDPELLSAVIAAAGPIGQSIVDEAARIGQAQAQGRQEPAAQPATTETAASGGAIVEPILPPAPQFGAVVDAAHGVGGQDASGRDDDRFRRPDDPARAAADGMVERGHLDKLGDRNGEVGERSGHVGERNAEIGERGGELGGRDAAHTEPELPSWVQPQDRPRMLAWLADDEDVVHLQPIPETSGARSLRRACDWILAGLIGLGFLAIIVAAVAEKVIDSLLPSDANGLVALAVVGAALLACITWIVGGVARAAEIRIAQQVSLDWLDARGPEQRRRGLPPVLLQHFLGPIPGGRLLTVGAYSCSVAGGIGLIGGIVLTVDPEDLGAATGLVVLGIGVVLTAAGVALFLLRWRTTRRQRELAVELGGERLAFLGNL